MKKIVMFLLASLTLSLPALAQQSDSKTVRFIKEHLAFDAQMAISAGDKTQFSESFDLGVLMTKDFYAFARLDQLWSLYDTDGNRTYRHANILGGGLGYRLFNNSEQRVSVDLRAQMGQSIGSGSMNCTQYDAGVLFRLGGRVLVPTIGLGFRHQHSHTAGFGHQNNVYLTFGISL